MANRTGPKTPPVVLSEEESQFLQAAIRCRKTPHGMATRYRIVLYCADGTSNRKIALRLGLDDRTVGFWRKRFLAEGLAGLVDRPRPGRPRSITDEEVKDVVDRTRGEKPDASTHWSLRLMAKAAGMSHTSVWRIWKAFGLKPHLVRTFKFSTDKRFVEKFTDAYSLMRSPPEGETVISLDEKTQMQARAAMGIVLPMRPCHPEARAHDYRRNGTRALYAALDVRTGRIVHAMCFRRHRAKEFLVFLRELEKRLPKGMKVRIVLDNASSHYTREVRAWLAARPHWSFHFTPTSTSWINQIERWFAELERRVLKRGVFHSIRELVLAVYEFVERYNATARPYRWTKSAEEVLASINRFRLHLGDPQYSIN